MGADHRPFEASPLTCYKNKYIMRQKLVVLTGAGISAESGISTFRDNGGLWEGHRVEDVATPEAWETNPNLVIDFYNERRRKVAEASPNDAHRALAELESSHDVTIITQNVDDLHERGGSTDILHLHGEIFKMRSEKDLNRTFPIHGDMDYGARAADGGLLRPHIVWFGEAVPMIDKAVQITRKAEVFAVIGTSLLVYPAAGLLQFVREGVPIYIIDKKIPNIPADPSIVTIETTAVEGVRRLMGLLRPSVQRGES
jgi:NAD-dependent deacetylase